ncbi:MAG: hypothetical protein K6D02_02390 [Lachnospiraceae bacterium]|nr:hypothetical protein [Lachnospiraceae bacterium]
MANEIQNTATLSEEENKELKKKSAIKMAVMLLLLVILLIFAVIAWFSMNKESDTDSVNMTAKDIEYVISPLEGSNGIYYNDYHSVIREDTSSDAYVWQMTTNENMDNVDGSDGISPGDSGKISFNVTPKIDSVTATFDFEIIGYEAGTETDETTQEESITMTEIANTSLKNYLNGHILLFEDYDSTTGEYSGLISSDADMERIIQKTFTGIDTATQVDIYWLWPENLSNLIEVYDGTDVLVHSLIADDTYDDVIQHICDYPAYFFRGGNDTEDSRFQNLTETKLKNSYDDYGRLYDAADNDIGTGINFIFVKMTTS